MEKLDKETGLKAAELVNARFRAELEQRKAGLGKAALRIAQALDAKTVKQFCFQGEIVEASPLTDHKTRLEAAKIVMDVFGASSSIKHELTGKDGEPLKFIVTVTDD